MKKFLYRLINFWSYMIMVVIIIVLFIKDINKLGLVDWAMDGESEEYTKSVQERVSKIYPHKIGIVISILCWITAINFLL